MILTSEISLHSWKQPRSKISIRFLYTIIQNSFNYEIDIPVCKSETVPASQKPSLILFNTLPIRISIQESIVIGCYAKFTVVAEADRRGEFRQLCPLSFFVRRFTCSTPNRQEFPIGSVSEAVLWFARLICDPTCTAKMIEVIESGFFFS